MAAIVATNIAIIQSKKISLGFAEEGFTAALAAIIAASINVNPDTCSTSGFYFVLCLIAFLSCGKMQEIIICHSFFS
jgi:hypothetical protein